MTITCFIPCSDCEDKGIFRIIKGKVESESYDYIHIDIKNENKATYFADSITVESILDIYETFCYEGKSYYSLLYKEDKLKSINTLDRVEYFSFGTTNIKNQKYFTTYSAAKEYLVFHYLSLTKDKDLIVKTKDNIINSYHLNGNINVSCERKNGKNEGRYQVFDEKGNKLKECMYFNNKLNGVCYDYIYDECDDVVMKSETHYKDNCPIGVSKKYGIKDYLKYYEERIYNKEKMTIKSYKENLIDEWKIEEFIKGELVETNYYIYKNILDISGESLNFDEMKKNSYLLKTVKGKEVKTFNIIPEIKEGTEKFNKKSLEEKERIIKKETKERKIKERIEDIHNYINEKKEKAKVLAEEAKKINDSKA